MKTCKTISKLVTKINILTMILALGEISKNKKKGGTERKSEKERHREKIKKNEKGKREK